MKLTKRLGTLAAIHAAMFIAQAQTPTDLRNRPALDNNLPLEAVGPDDLLSLSVADCLDLTKTFRVSKDGKLMLPLLKESVTVSGLTPPAISDLVARELIKSQILVQPVVSVQVLEYRSHMVTVAGAVKRPGQVQVAGRMTLLDVLSAADGISPEAGAVVVLTSANTQARQVIPLKKLLESPTVENNPVLRGGEEVRVPEAAKVYVMGNVKKPGVFSLHDAPTTSVLKVMAECEGTLPYSKGTAFIYRQDDAGKRQEIPVELSALLARKSPDIPLFGSDVLYVPDSKGKRLGIGMLDRIVQFGSYNSTRILVP